jgi:hypothetical protein
MVTDAESCGLGGEQRADLKGGKEAADRGDRVD